VIAKSSVHGLFFARLHVRREVSSECVGWRVLMHAAHDGNKQETADGGRWG
jgi:hypothetical protein